MAMSKPNAGTVADRVCNIMKMCRLEWLTALEITEEAGYSKDCSVRHTLKTLAAQGVLDMRIRRRKGVAGSAPAEYRVAQAWRNDA